MPRITGVEARYGLLAALLVAVTITGGCNDGISWSSHHERLEYREEEIAPAEVLSPESTQAIGIDRCPHDIWPGDFEIATVDDIQLITGYRAIAGELIIRSPELRDLSSLECLEQSGGIFIVGTRALTNVEALGNLSHVAGDLVIIGNSALEDIDGLGSLVTIHGSLKIMDNVLLHDLYGLGSLDTIEEELHIKSNPTLVDLEGLINLRRVRGAMMTVRYNKNLTSLGLEGLCIVNGDVWIEYNLNLPQCLADDLYTQLVERDFQGEIYAEGNDEETECEDVDPRALPFENFNSDHWV